MLVVTHPAGCAQERDYIFGVVLGDFLGLEWQARVEQRHDVEITVPALSPSRRLTIADRLFAVSAQGDVAEQRLPGWWLTERSLPKSPLPRWRPPEPLAPTLAEPELPVLYGEELPCGSHLEERDEDLALGLDLFGSVFFLLSRYEEVALSARDGHDRFPAEASIASTEGFLRRPLANEYVEVLWAALHHLWPRIQRRRRTFQVRPSHDVDWPMHPTTSLPRAAKGALGNLLRHREPRLSRASFRALRGRRSDDPYDTFDFMMEVSERHGLRSAFYFMAGSTNSAYDGDYSLEDPWIEGLLGRIHGRGHELGLHPSYETFRDSAALISERDALIAACERADVRQEHWGGRQHFLRWQSPVTWRAWEEAGMSYDSSLGYPRDPGFRCGVCFEYRVFDLIARRALDLRERPLIVMEASLVGDGDGAGSAQRALDEIALLCERCRLFEGEFTLLWHNSRLTSKRERELYRTAVGWAAGASR